MGEEIIHPKKIKKSQPNTLKKQISTYKRTSGCLKNSKKQISNNGGKTLSRSQVKDYRDSIPKKISEQKIRLTKPLKKSRNASKHSISKYGGKEVKTYQSVLKPKKEIKAHSESVTSPEEKKARSGKTTKSSMTNSTQTNTGNKKRRGELSSYGDTKSNLCPTFLGIGDNQGKTTAIKYDREMKKRHKQGYKNNETISHNSLADLIEHSDHFDEANQTVEFEHQKYTETSQMIPSSTILYSGRNSMHANSRPKGLKVKGSKSGNKLKKRKAIKKSTAYDFGPFEKSSTVNTSQNPSVTFREQKDISSRRNSVNKSLIRTKSSKYFWAQDDRKKSLCSRRQSHNMKSTSHLFHLPKQGEFKYGKTYTSKHKQAGKSKTKFFGNGSFKKAPSSTKHKGRLHMTRSFSNINIKGKSKTRQLINIVSNSDFRVKKISNTKQPDKPKDIKPDVMTEIEGSSFKGSKASVIKNTPTQSLEKKMPGSRINQRGMSVQINLIFSKSDMKNTKKLSQTDNTESEFRTEQKQGKYFDRENIDNLRKDPEGKKQKSHRKNKNNFEKFEQNCLVRAREQLDQATDLKRTQTLEENLVKRLDFSTNVINKEENLHPNKVPVKTDRTEKMEVVQKIPLGEEASAEIQNSAPQQKKDDQVFLDAIFSGEEESNKNLQPKDNSASNGVDSQREGSTNSNGSKFVVKKMENHGELLGSSFALSSVMQSSRISNIYSVSESAGMLDSKSQESREDTMQPDIPRFNHEKELQWSAWTYDLSESQDDHAHTVDDKAEDHKISQKQPEEGKQDPFTLSSENFTKGNPENNKIFIQTTYVDDKAESFEQLNVQVPNIPEEPLEEEELKRVEVSDIMDLEISPQSTPKPAPEVASVQIDLHQENADTLQDLYSSKSKYQRF